MKTTRHNAIGKCRSCGDLLHSYAGGVFRSCSCKKSFIDQERFSGYYVRLGGECEYIEQICPATCKHRKDKNHLNNKRKLTRNSLNTYLLKTYNIENGGYNDPIE